MIESSQEDPVDDVFVPKEKAIKVGEQLRQIIGEHLLIQCSNDEKMLFLTFTEQVAEATDCLQD